MSRKARYYRLLEKSIQASLSAIEVYNKPDFKYREESFSILMVNAWEVSNLSQCFTEMSPSLYCSLPTTAIYKI
jgi:hypothetical protein